MSNAVPVIALLIGALLIVSQITVSQKRNSKRRQQLALIGQGRFPPSVLTAVAQRYPHLSHEQQQQVITGLRHYFQLCHRAGRQMVSMPSQAVDVAWHAFILDTRHYQNFCNQAFNRFLHHVPATAMDSPQQAQAGLKRAWRLACEQERINPRQPTRLPLLFALDGMLAIDDGFIYQLDCLREGALPSGHCVTSFGCGSSSSGCSSSFDSGDSGSSSDSGCSSGCSSGCGGGGD